MIPGSGRSPGEGIGYPLQYSWAYLVAQLVKNLPAMWDTWVWLLGWEDLLEKGKATHSNILAWKILYSHWGRKESDDWATFTLFFISVLKKRFGDSYFNMKYECLITFRMTITVSVRFYNNINCWLSHEVILLGLSDICVGKTFKCSEYSYWSLTLVI